MLVTNHNVSEILQKLKSHKVFVIDIETTGLEVQYEDRLVGVGIGLSDLSTYYFPFRHFEGNLDFIHLVSLMKILSNAHCFIGFNVKFDLFGLHQDGLIIKDQKIIDVIVMSRLLSPGKYDPLNLVSSYKRFINPYFDSHKITLVDYMKEHKVKSHALVEVNVESGYCCEDVRLTFELYLYLMHKIHELEAYKLFDLELNTTKTLFGMELRGALIDQEYCLSACSDLDQKVLELEKKAYTLTKDVQEEPVNILSSRQIGKIFIALGFTSPSKTEKGNDSWNDSALITIDHPLSDIVKEYRTLRKLRDTYFKPFISKSVIHPTFKNWGTITGRLSCANPNLQNIPRYQRNIHGETSIEIDEEQRKQIEAMVKSKLSSGSSTVGGHSATAWMYAGDTDYSDEDNMISVRRLFISRPGFTYFTFDFSQMEVKVFISYIHNEKILEEIQDRNFDFHSFVCKTVFGYDESHPNFSFWRQISKAITFGLIYGMGDGLLASTMQQTKEQAIKFRKKYFDKLEGSKEFIDTVFRKLKDRGYVFNRYGRRYFIPANKNYVAINYLVQGTSGDIVKDRMNHVNEYLSDKNSRIINQIHDELLIEVHNNEIDIVVPKIASILEHNDFKIPLSVDVSRCDPSWAHKTKKG